MTFPTMAPSGRGRLFWIPGPAWDLQGYLQPALKARVDQYVQQCVADAVECAVATIEGKVEALKARVDQQETALQEKEPGTPRRQKVDKQVSVST